MLKFGNCIYAHFSISVISKATSLRKRRTKREKCMCVWVIEWVALLISLAHEWWIGKLWFLWPLPTKESFYYNKCWGHSSLGKEKKKHLCQQPQLISIPPQFAESYTYFKANLPKIVSCCLMSAMHAWMPPSLYSPLRSSDPIYLMLLHLANSWFTVHNSCQPIPLYGLDIRSHCPFPRWRYMHLSSLRSICVDIFDYSQY